MRGARVFKLLFTLSGIGLMSPVTACPFCNRQVREGIINSQFYPNLLTMLSAFIALAIVVVLLVAWSNRHLRRKRSARQESKGNPIPLTTAATIIGIGFGGFIDGIVLHQVFQVHEMLSAKIPSDNYVGKSINMFWDGIFHFFCLLVTMAGVVMLWKV